MPLLLPVLSGRMGSRGRKMMKRIHSQEILAHALHRGLAAGHFASGRLLFAGWCDRCSVASHHPLEATTGTAISSSLSTQFDAKRCPTQTYIEPPDRDVCLITFTAPSPSIATIWSVSCEGRARALSRRATRAVTIIQVDR